MELIDFLRPKDNQVRKKKRSGTCQESSGSNSFTPNTPNSKGMEKRSQKRKKNNESSSHFRWSHLQTKCLLEFLAGKVRDGERCTANGFKGQVVVEGAKHVAECFDEVVEPHHVYNHLRGWKNKWMRIEQARNLSGVSWDDSKKMIVMGLEEAMTYLKANYKDEGLINKPIEFYEELALVCGPDFATGQFAKDTQDPLGTHDFAGDDEMGHDFTVDIDSVGGPSNSNGPKSMSINQSKGSKKTGTSRKAKDRHYEAIEGMTRAVWGVAEALKAKNMANDSRAQKLMDALQPLAEHGFNADQIDMACDHLMLEPPMAATFFARSVERRVVWMRTFCAKHCPE